jgi:hypothetical protein
MCMFALRCEGEMMARMGSVGIVFGKISIYSEKDGLEDLKKMLDDVLERHGYPSEDHRVDMKKILEEDGKKEEKREEVVDLEDLPEIEENQGEELDEDGIAMMEEGDEEEGKQYPDSPWLKKKV